MNWKMSNNKESKPYEITPLTMAILAYFDQDGNRKTCILEKEEEYYVDSTPSKVISKACQFFGSSLEGRQEGTRYISGFTHKAPIAIDPHGGLYFFPTGSPTSPSCSWISHTHIQNIAEAKKQKTELVFTNGKRIIIDVSIGSMMNQVYRTSHFRYLLGKRINPLKSKQHHLIRQLIASSGTDPFGSL